jgi:hypothetical protein
MFIGVHHPTFNIIGVYRVEKKFATTTEIGIFLIRMPFAHTCLDLAALNLCKHRRCLEAHATRAKVY